MNENENKIYQKIWNAAKAILTGTFPNIALNTYVRKEDGSILN